MPRVGMGKPQIRIPKSEWKSCSKAYWKPQGSIGNNFHAQLAAARPVELAEIYALPAAEHQTAVFNQQGFRDADERGLEMGIAIAVVVMVVVADRRQAL